jgi:large subunit ribosomal protein L20
MGYFGGRKNLYRTAKDAVEKGWQHAYRDRKNRKRTFRRLWITRINAAARENELSYSRFMNGLKQAGVELDRKALADLAVRSPEAFTALADRAKAGLGAG